MRQPPRNRVGPYVLASSNVLDGERLPRPLAWSLEWAAARGLKFLVQHLAVPQQRAAENALVMDFAARNGHLEILQWLHATERLSGCSTRSMNDAAKNGHLAIVQWLHGHRSEGCTTKAMDLSAQHGHLDVLVWLDTNERVMMARRSPDRELASDSQVPIWTPLALDLAATNGHLALVQWLTDHHARDCLTLDAFNAAAYMDHLEIVQFLYTHAQASCSLAQGLEHAEEGGAEDTLAWLQSVGGV